MSRRALAVFDLDRTLITSSSATVFRKHLAAHGLGGGHDLPLVDVLTRFYEQFGETWLMMQPARLSSRAASGWSVATVEAAMQEAGDELVEMLLPGALKAMEEHRAAGRRLVMATTSPLVFVKPFADRAGFDDVVATQWERTAGPDGDEVFTGRMTGQFVWGRSKSDAVALWARDHDANLAESWAYSDSYFDAPLLAKVGHPVVVNPDLQLRVTATIRGWPVVHFDRSDGVSKILGRELQEWGRPFMRREIVTPNARIEFEGLENIPATGPAIVVFNHRSYFDPIVMGLVIAKTGRNVRGLGKKEVFDVPLVGRLMKASGGIRVDRGTGSDEPLDAAIAASSRRAADDRPGGHDPSRPRLLRSGAEGAVGRRPHRRGDRCTGDPDRAVGHREGVAAQLPTAEDVADRPPARHRHRRPAGEADAPQPRRRHEADHEGDQRRTAAGGSPASDADTRGVGAHLPARVSR
jgi:putative phosphoserine phosphatase / 1-acylglycerol-3-phosphate O-acyltransferase